MRKTTLATTALVMTIGAALGTTPARALSNKTWVSANGVDTFGGVCSLSQPCRTLFSAYLQTAAGGEVGIIGPGDYGTMLISGAISITNDGGGEAAIQAINTSTPGSPSSAIYIDAGSNDVIQLRGLTIDGAATTFPENGISSGRVAGLYVQNCVIKNFRNGGLGIAFSPDTTGALIVSDTTLANNSTGLYVSPWAGTTGVTLERVIVSGSNYYGVMVTGKSTGSVNVTVTDSVISGNPGYGILADPTGGGSFVVMVARSKSVNNGVGVASFGANATVLLSNSTITGNISGLISVNAGVIGSYGNNDIDQNNTNGAPTKTYTQK